MKCCLQKELLLVACDALVALVGWHKDPHKRANEECILYAALDHARTCTDPHCERCENFLNRLKEGKS
jgi:hypothetical protein